MRAPRPKVARVPFIVKSRYTVYGRPVYSVSLSSVSFDIPHSIPHVPYHVQLLRQTFVFERNINDRV